MKNLLVNYFILTIPLFGQVFNGMTLYSPAQAGGGGGGNFYSYLIDNDLNEINTWTHPRGAASMPYLMPDGTLVYPYRVSNPAMNAGGTGGGISTYSWDGDLLWNYEISNSNYQHHHDVEPLPNGNILVIAWELKTAEEAYAVGRQSIDNSLNIMWAEAIFELEPVGSDDVNIVWEWHIWDHLIQDVDSDLPNYGVISDHPELQDVNYGAAGSNGGPGGANGDWKHINAIAYNEELDQIVISSRHHDEIYIIDHSTTTEEAAGHVGGNAGKGGDYLYRWGNPQAYGRGSNSDHLLGSQHSVNWIPEGYPGEGNLILFNNNYTNYSAVFEFTTPLNDDGTYAISEGQPFGPEEPVWLHTGDFHTQMQGGAFRLPNGNTLVTDCDDATIFEVTEDHQEVWSHDHGGGQVFIARAQKYAMNYLGDDFPDYELGDVNFDGFLDVQDILFISDMASGFGYESTPPADYNEDHSVDLSDLILLVQTVLSN
ncbi:MAG: aryl-sulfate sulfotransferase [Candidatus Marinimicrobia bacterium]|jgi:hypothetical protein|nr:aryl-sulfate sulfotransferase [Candidatus Neomarinimicrobiota bacterium]|tara:strand:- start:2455 stop:3906 length:1452 start_codon:yes stop_codon:yes gene_type:complete